MPPDLSVVIPIYNESPNVRQLHAELTATLETWGRPYEIVAVDDGSRDDSFQILSELHASMFDGPGETIPRNFISREEVEADIAEALPKIQGGMDLRSGEGLVTAFKVVARQYVRSWGIRGDNTPEKAAELGYVTSKELWPEMEFVKYEDFLREAVKGEAKPVYDEETRAGYRQAWEGIKAQKKQQQQQQK